MREGSAGASPAQTSFIRRLWELATLFLKLGAIGFGGPAAHIAIMEDEVVRRRGWLSHEDYIDLVGATNLIPGPNSTEMAMHVGYRRAGFAGLVVAGTCFILPAVLVTVFFTWLYVQSGRFPAEVVAPPLDGIRAAIMAVIVAALVPLVRKSFKTRWLTALGIATAVAAIFLPGREITVLLAAAAVGTLLSLTFQRSKKQATPTVEDEPSPRSSIVGPLALAGGAVVAASTMHKLLLLGLFFLKVGAVLYGSGYVLIAYLRGGLVEDYGWLTDSQLVDAVAIGQFTPGPILSTAACVGFLVMCPTPKGDMWLGLQGAIIASTAIFLPSFAFVALLGPLVPRLRKSRWAASFLDCVNAASIGLMIAIGLVLCWQVFVAQDAATGHYHARWWLVVVAALALAIRLRWKLSPAWIVLGGALAGWLISTIGY